MWTVAATVCCCGWEQRVADSADSAVPQLFGPPPPILHSHLLGLISSPFLRFLSKSSTYNLANLNLQSLQGFIPNFPNFCRRSTPTYMPATILPSAKHNTKPAHKPNGHHKPKGTRIVRRRGRGRDVIESDDELEREARSDSGSDDEDNSSSGSDSDDDGFSGSANLTKDAVVTPSTTQSPPPDDKPLSNGNITHDPKPTTELSAYKDASNYWDALDDEDPWGVTPAEVAFDNHDQLAGETRPRRKSRNKKKKKQQASADAGNDDTADVDPEASPSHGTGFPSRGRSVRETYRDRLQDPSYVPTVGEFWGHDDRLLDKDLRSLSGWWRGRWHRGRGGYSGRGRGGFHGGGDFNWDQSQEEANNHPSEQQTWGHDGFEEMKKKEEQRRLAREQRQKEQREAATTRGTPFQRGSARGGRGGPIGTRGRGFSRGGFSPSSPRPPLIDRPWYAQKPERVWTKQLDGFLHFDSSLKAKLGQGQGYRVKLAGSKEKVIRASPEVYVTQTADQVNPATTATTSSSENVTSPSVDNKTVTVRLPKLKEKETSPEAPPPISVPEPAPVEMETTLTSLPAETEESLDEVFTVKPRPVPAPSILTIVPPTTTEDPVTSQLRSEFVERAVVKPSPSQSVDNTDAKDTPQSPAESQRPAPPALHPIRTVFTPVAPQPQTYATPYQYPPHLPPGIAVNSQGITYEIATGRPVYLQPTPPPVYDPRPVMPPMHPGAVPFIPGHVHHLSGHSVDFAHSRPHSVSGYDPVTGMALFSLPRQNSRIEIRRPDGSIPTSPPVAPQAHRPSGLRTIVSAQDGDDGFQESQVRTQQSDQPSDYYPSIADQRPGDGHTSPTPHVDPRSNNGTQHPGLNPNVMAYQPQPYPYYGYPDYGYPQYMDMSQMGYEMYPDPHHSHQNSQSSIYY